MKETTNYKLKKIDLTDSPPDITVLNPNFDTIDTQLKNNSNEIKNLNEKTGINCLSKPGVDADNVLETTKIFIIHGVNTPDLHGFLEVEYFDGSGYSPSPPDKGGVVKQKFTNHSDLVWIRQKYDGIWGNWQQIATTDKIDILCTPKPGFTIPSKEQASYYIDNGFCFINIYTTGDVPANTDTIVATLPFGIVKSTVVNAYNFVSKTPVIAYIDTNNIYVRSSIALSGVRINGVIIK